MLGRTQQNQPSESKVSQIEIGRSIFSLSRPPRDTYGESKMKLPSGGDIRWTPINRPIIRLTIRTEIYMFSSKPYNRMMKLQILEDIGWVIGERAVLHQSFKNQIV